MLDTGERQVAPMLSGIRRDHVARYEFAARVLCGAPRIIDLACGVGYGAEILATAGSEVLAIDRSPDAVAYGQRHYNSSGRVRFVCQNAEDLRLALPYDAAVCFETIEHIEDPLPVLQFLCRHARRLVASVPNEAVFPHRGAVKFHYRHYTRAEFGELLQRAGYRVISWHGQAGPFSEVEPEIEGRTLIAVAERETNGGQRIDVAPTAKPGEIEAPATAAVPEHVAIIGLGPSCAQFFELTRRLGGISAFCDEVWGINAIGDVLRCDRVFHMDDVRIQEARAAANPNGNIAAMVRWLKRHPGPVYTSVPHPDYPGLVAYPLEDVLNRRHDSNGGAPYFNSTAAYAIAYAVHIGVKHL